MTSTLLLTTLALLAFAANSLLARLALAQPAIGAASFTVARLASGALVLSILVRGSTGTWHPLRWRGLAGPAALFLYALPFSLSYVRIGAATGALLLFGSVQLTMVVIALIRGERPRPLAWCGFTLAAVGLAWLVGPVATRPDLPGVLLMATAGIAWGVYTVLGRTAGDPLAANARAFLFATPVAVLAMVLLPDAAPPTTGGLTLAALSGAITSGLGYAVWYRVLPRLGVARAAFAQLAVPAIAAFGAVVCLGENLTTHVTISGLLVLGGVGLALTAPTNVR